MRIKFPALAAPLCVCLDNVVDINYYSVDKAKRSNVRHRPVGLGVMGFQDMLVKNAPSLRLARSS